MSDPAPDPAAHTARHRSDRPEQEPDGSAEWTAEGTEEAAPHFAPKPFLRTGYDRGAVDAFTTVVVLAIHEERQTTVTADDVARVRFPARRFGHGYRMREVDDYLGAAEALLRMRAAASGVAPDPERAEVPEHQHHPTWWIYGVAVLLAVVVVVFTLTQV